MHQAIEVRGKWDAIPDPETKPPSAK